MKQHYTMTLVTAFSTGRGYTDKGQRISVYMLTVADGLKVQQALLMKDWDRDIDYLFEAVDLIGENGVRDYVMTGYDYDRFKLYDAQLRMLGTDALRLLNPAYLEFPVYHYQVHNL